MEASTGVMAVIVCVVASMVIVNTRLHGVGVWGSLVTLSIVSYYCDCTIFQHNLLMKLYSSGYYLASPLSLNSYSLNPYHDNHFFAPFQLTRWYSSNYHLFSHFLSFYFFWTLHLVAQYGVGLDRNYGGHGLCGSIGSVGEHMRLYGVRGICCIPPCGDGWSWIIVRMLMATSQAMNMKNAWDKLRVEG